MLKLSWMAVAVILLIGCADIASVDQAFEGQTAEQLVQRGNRALANGFYRQAIASFEALTTHYPASRYNETALLNTANSYYKTGEYLLAAATATDYIHLYPRSKHIVEAYYLRALAYFEHPKNGLEKNFNVNYALRDNENQKKAYAYFEELSERFPESPYAVKASRCMKLLRDAFAEKELKIAQFYLARKQYKAAAQRAERVLRNYKETAQAEQAKVLLKQAIQ